MAITGKYDVIIDTPIGAQSGVFTFKTEGKFYTEKPRLSVATGFLPVLSDGEHAQWSDTIISPMGGNIYLTFNIKVTAIDLSGTVVLGPFGSAAVRGKRA